MPTNFLFPKFNANRSRATIPYISAALFLAHSFCLGATAMAQDTVTWNNSAGGNWNTATNWSPARVPTTNDIAVISLPGTYTVTLSSGTAAPTSLTVGGSNAVVTLQQLAGTLAPQQASSLLAGSTYRLDAGSLSGAGDLTINGAFTSTGGTLSTGGKLVLAEGCTSIVSGGFSKEVGRVVENRGTLTVNGSWEFIASGLVDNQATGTLILSGNGRVTRTSGSPGGIKNSGQIIRRGTGTTTRIEGLPLNNLSGGTVRLEAGTLQPSGGFNQSGIVSGTGTVASSFTNNGIIRPDAVPGGLTISGNLTQGSAGRIELTLGAADATLGHRSLTVSGVSGIANFAGTLSVTRSAAFTETNGASFEVIRFSSRTNDFSAAEGLGPVSGVALLRSFTTTSLNLTVGIVPELSVGSGLSGKVAVSTNYAITATGTGPITFSASSLPTGLNINSGTGTIAGTPSAAGNGTASIVASNNFGAVTNPLSWTIAKGTSTINTAPTANIIAQGQTLSTSVLTGGSANVAGAFAWTDESIVPTESGAYSVTFTPTDFSNYDTATTNVPVTVRSTNANLVSLAISSGSLSPDFAGGNTNYTASVDYDTASVTVTPTVSDATATVAVNGTAVTSGTASTAISLNVGPNTINVLVAAEDPATTKLYTITVTRAQETVAPVITLIGDNPLTITRGSSFTDPGADVTDNVDAPRKISGTGSVNTSVAGTYTLTYSATDAAGNVATPVTRTVNVVNSTNANLSGLTISNGSLSPAFASTTTDYTANVSFSVTSVTVTPTVADPTATVTVNGSSNLTNPISLNVGDNTITVLVTAQDGTTTKTYTVTVTRAALSTNANLSALTISGGSLTPVFSSNTTTYAANVDNAVATITVTPTASDATASITLNGSSITSGSARTVALDIGSNQIPIVVTAQDGVTTKTYSITVARASASVNPWTEVFGSGTNTFTIDFVDIGNTNNPADASGYGAVPYGYRMATYEIPQDAIAKAAASGLSNVTAGAWTGNRPAANVSWLEAAAFVNWLNTSKGYQAAYNMIFTNGAWTVQPWSSADAWTVGGTNLYRHKDAYYFLPNENEWYKSAYYDAAATSYFPYPTASSKAPTAVGDGTTIGTAVYNGVTNTPAEVANAGGLSPYGTMGQGGNVAEWNEPTLDGSTNITIRVVRGGNWSASASALLSTTRGSASQTDRSSTTGFRVATVQPRPSKGFTDWAQGAPLTPQNLLKYAIGGASGPNATDGINMIPSVGASNLCATVIVRTNDPLLAIFGQSTGNLSSGGWASSSVTRTATGLSQTGVPLGLQRQMFCAPHGGDGREFIRMTVELIPPLLRPVDDSFGSGTNTFTMEFVGLGNTNSAADTNGYGAVPYAYRLGKYEITQSAIDKARANGMPTFISTTATWTNSNRPAHFISWYDAAIFVNWLNTSEGYQPAYNLTLSTNGNLSMQLWTSSQAWTNGGTNLLRHKNARYFLPSENEWYKAAYHNSAGTNYFLYPTATNAAPTAVAGGTNARTAVYGQPFAQGPAAVTNAGGLSSYGTMGQGGNVLEWLETAYDGNNDSPYEDRTMRGGSFADTADFLRSSSERYAIPATTANNSGLGFRVASVPSGPSQATNSNNSPAP